MRYLCYFLLIIVLFVEEAFANEANVTFIADKPCEVLIYKPIDGGYNDKVIAERGMAEGGKAFRFKMKISKSVFILCRFPQYQRSCNVLLCPNDSVTIILKKQSLTFQGDNCNGLQYYYDNFEKEPDIDNYLKMQNVFREYIDGKRNLYSAFRSLENELNYSFLFLRIHNMLSDAEISKEFSDILEKEIYMYINSDIVSFLDYAFSEKQKNKSLTVKDSLEIQGMVDCIYEKLPVSYDLLKYPSNIYVWRYYGHYYKDKKCPEEYDSDMCGPYTKYLFASPEMQPALLGHACLVQLKYNTGEMDLTKLKKFFNEKFPESEYAGIINKRFREKTDSDNETSVNWHLIYEPINCLSQLSSLQELQGKYLYIDLWASWCMPCRAEFDYKDQVKNIMKSYENVETVYISMDTKKQEKAWMNCIEHYKLEGFHLMASAALVKNITKEIYSSERFDIPRYVLISPNGKILNVNLPRPSDYSQLKVVLDSIINDATDGNV